ncbi:cupin domain-containing protein, partial [Candidatus Parcubacteria bacterium]|nr:cupin domain-containing protein [Candidatus Parcubacteria bacterium]
EVHEDHDQFIRVEEGSGKATIGEDEFELEDGSAIVVPAGAWHNVTNTSEHDLMKLYTVYAPPEHPEGTVQKDKPEND